MVVRLYFDGNVNGLFMGTIRMGLGVWIETPGGIALNHSRVVCICAEHTIGALCVRMANHFKQAFRHVLAIHCPTRIEDLVTAML